MELKSFGLSAPLPGDGLLIVTYMTLTSKGRIEQLLHWLGDDFEGVVAFDEAHKVRRGGGSCGWAMLRMGLRQSDTKANKNVIVVGDRRRTWCRPTHRPKAASPAPRYHSCTSAS